MKLIQETPARLVLEERPWVLGSALIIGILVFLALALGLWTVTVWLTLGFGLAALLLAVCFVVFVQRVIVILDREAGALVIRTRNLMGQGERTLALSEVSGAEVETSRSTSTSNNGGRTTSVTHRTVIATRSGPVPLTNIYTSGSGAENNAAAINRWLAAAPR
jgi:hypothetical protein